MGLRIRRFRNSAEAREVVGPTADVVPPHLFLEDPPPPGTGGEWRECADGTHAIALTPETLGRLLPSPLGPDLRDCLDSLLASAPMTFGDHSLQFDRPNVMGILNVTPDSFSDGGRYLSHAAAEARAMEMVAEGADIIDIGGESTRPFSRPVDEEGEMRRVLPAIEAASPLGVPISIDTRKPRVAERALEAGASIINDVSGLRDPGMIEVAASAEAPVIIMHMLGTPEDMQVAPRYEDVVREIFLYLEGRCLAAMEGGVDASRIIVDPGIGFGKRVQDNLGILRRLGEFRCLGHPVLVGASRKGFIGKVLGEGVSEREEGSLAVATVAAMNGADILRAHDVQATSRALRMVQALR